jgi:hypothetical protein
MIPEHFYITDLGIMAYGFIYLPMVLAVAVLLWRILRLSWKVNTPIVLTLLTLPFWDVYMIGRDADRLCNSEAGLHVYKTVRAEGFLGGAAERWLKYGFNYIEGGGGKFKSRYTMQDGKVKHHRVDKFMSRYAVGTADNHKVVTKSISKSSKVVMDRDTKEILGDLVVFNIYPGLFDGILMKFVQSSPVVWHCGNEPLAGRKDGLGYGDVVMAVIKPKKSEGDEQ